MKEMKFRKIRVSSAAAGLLLIIGVYLMMMLGSYMDQAVYGTGTYILLAILMIGGMDMLIPPVLVFILVYPFLWGYVPLQYVIDLPASRYAVRLYVHIAAFILTGFYIYSSANGQSRRRFFWFLPGVLLIAEVIYRLHIPLDILQRGQLLSVLRSIFLYGGPDIVLALSLLVYCSRFGRREDMGESSALRQVHKGKTVSAGRKISAGKKVSAEDDWKGSPGGNAFEPESPLTSGFEIGPDKSSLRKKGGRDLWDR